jgi:cytochrome c2
VIVFQFALVAGRKLVLHGGSRESNALEYLMPKLLGFVSALVLVAVFVGGASGFLGYYAHKNAFEPIFSFVERVEVKLRRELPGLRSDTELSVERVETTFVTLRGRVHVMPGRDFQGGGGLTVWGEDLVVMHMSGQVFWLERDDSSGLMRSYLELPDNGRQAYARLAAESYPGRNPLLDRLRYHDIEFVDSGDRRGLLLSYTYVDAGNHCYRSRMAWLPIAREIASIQDLVASKEDWTVVYETSPCLRFSESGELMLAYMAGGGLAFQPPNLVYLGVGDYHLDGIYRPDAGIQSPDSDYGKVIQIHMDTGDARHFSKGHRNIQALTLDQAGRLWGTEHGMRAGDELNLILDGENYGWPIEDMGTLYSGIPNASPSGPGRHETYRAPVFAWLPAAALSSITTINGFDDAWDGDLLVGSLAGQSLFRARIEGERLVVLEPIPIGHRIRDVTQWNSDRLALWLDFNEVVVFEIEPRVDPLDGLAARLVSTGMESSLADQVVDVLYDCNQCHSYQPNVHAIGPSLVGVVGGRAAGTTFGGYSGALQDFGGVWTQERLAEYLADPEGVVPGTLMTGLGLLERELAVAVVVALDLLD